MKRPKIADIARDTGLTIGTVSRALDTSGKYAISPNTRDRVLESADRLGYRPNVLGRALAVGSSKLILLLTPNPFTPYYVEINRHLSNLASGRGYSFLAASTLPISEASIPANDWLYGADGLIVCDGMPAWGSYVSEALRLKIPVVGIGTGRDSLPADQVSVDLITATRDLIAHLVGVGSKSPTLVSTPGAELGDPRYLGYVEAAERMGFEARVVEATFQTRPSARAAVAEAYSRRPFDGLICENDLMASGALRGLCDLGVRVPEDVLLSGCDGLEESAYQIVPFTTIVQPIEEMCQAAWEMLQARIDGDVSLPKDIQMQAKLEIRGSTTRTAQG